MQPDKIAMSMSAFEKAFENIEVAVGSMTGAMDVATGSMVPTEEVEEMMRQIAHVSWRCMPAPRRVCCCSPNQLPPHHMNVTLFATGKRY